MVLEQYKWQATDPWTWRHANLSDIVPIMELMTKYYKCEMEQFLDCEPGIMYRNLAHAIVDQTFNAMTQQIGIAEQSGQIIAWSWIDRGHHTPYSSEELAEPKIAHIDLSLPVRQRVRLMAQIIQRWEMWCYTCDIPVIMSTSIREDQDVFMRLHERAGYTVRGSFAFKRITNV